jgi:hypothetical protein
MITKDATAPFRYLSFALALNIGHSPYPCSEQRREGAYFNHAKNLIGDPLNKVQFSKEDLSIHSFMALYLIETGRWKDAYIRVGYAMR